MNSTIPFASDLSFQVYQKQRRDPQIAPVQINQSCKVAEARLDVIERFQIDEVVRSEDHSLRFARGGRDRSLRSREI